MIARPESEERTRRRDALADEIASLVLREGLRQLGLRGLAARLSTSGRMLLYYFATKDALVVAVLARISGRLGAIMAAHSTGPPVTAGAFLARVLTLSREPEIAPFMRVWTEVVARGARGEEPYVKVAAETVGDWLEWIDSRLLPEARAHGVAAAILSIVEGATLLEMARPGTTLAARALLPGLLDGTG